MILPWADGLQAVIRDNISSHFSMEVIKQNQEKQTHFICWPPNSTHLLQPLKVSILHPIKLFWKETWSQRSTGAGKRAAPTFTATFKAGFRICGICPVTADPILFKVPEGKPMQDHINENVAAAVVDMLKSKERPAA